MRLLLALFIWSLCALSPAHARDGRDLYELSVDIAADGKRIGTPRLVMQAGQVGVVTGDERTGYAIRASLESAASSGDGLMVIDAEIHIGEGDGRILLGRPRLSFGLDQPVIVSYSKDGKAANLTFTLRKLEVDQASRVRG